MGGKPKRPRKPRRFDVLTRAMRRLEEITLLAEQVWAVDALPEGPEKERRKAEVSAAIARLKALGPSSAPPA